MKTGGTGGETTISGLCFEKKVDFLTLIEKIPGYKIIRKPNSKSGDIYYLGKLVAQCFKKYGFYHFLQSNGIDWKI